MKNKLIGLIMLIASAILSAKAFSKAFYFPPVSGSSVTEIPNMTHSGLREPVEAL